MRLGTGTYDSLNPRAGWWVGEWSKPTPAPSAWLRLPRILTRQVGRTVSKVLMDQSFPGMVNEES